MENKSESNSDKLERVIKIVEDAKKDSSFDRILNLVERHPILSVIVIYIFVAKVTNAVKYKEDHKYDR